MSFGADIRGSVDYTKMILENDVQIINAIWTIPNFRELLNNREIAEITIPEADLDWKFQFKMIFNRPKSEKIDIWYYASSSSNILFLQSVQMKSLVFNTENWTYEEDAIITIKTERQIILNNKWYSIHSLSNKGSYLCDNFKIIIVGTDGSLRLKFIFLLSEKQDKKKIDIPEKQLLNDLKNLFHEGTYSDVVMKSADNIEFKVHKAVLTSRCAVLKAHFDHNTTESVTNTVESPLESAVLREVLIFIYTEEAPKVDEIPEKLLAAADYYQLSRLKSLCEEALHKKLTVDNAIETFQLADLHSETLKQYTLEFIKDGRQHLITKTECWTELKSVDVLKTIFE